MAKRTKHQHLWRYAAFNWLIFLFFLVLVARLTQIQLVNRSQYVAVAEKQYKFEVHLEPKRGFIYDRNLELLTLNAPAVSIGIFPGKVTQPSRWAHQLSSVLGYNANNLYRELRSRKSFTWLARNVSPKMGDTINNLNVPGLQIHEGSKRSYPHGHVGCQVLGYVDLDGNGLSGIELTFNRLLRGKSGRAMLQRSANRDIFEQASYPVLKPIEGLNLMLTIDYVYQSIAEEELANTVSETGAQSGLAIIANPKTGELLAMATVPTFDPNNFKAHPPSTWRLRPITDQFEPGSTFKAAIMAGILEEGLLAPDSLVFCENGNYNIHGITINDTKPYGWLTVRDVLVNSSNIGMAKIAMGIYRQVIYRYARDFGFGQKTGIGLEGEIAGVLKNPVDWSGVTPAFMSFGHETSVTALQMTNMFNTIANGGLLIKPRIIQAVMNENNQVIERTRREIVRRVISKKTATTMIDIMQQVVSRGTGTKAQIDDLPIAGKTGTTKKVRPDGTGYLQDEYLSSFGGFFPANDPKLTIFVLIDSPHGQYYGGDIAAPCFRQILQRIIKLESMSSFMDMAKNEPDAATKIILVPDLFKRQTAVAEQILKELELTPRISGTGEYVLAQVPAPGELVKVGTQVLLKLTRLPDDSCATRAVPEVRGSPIRDALIQFAAAGIEISVEGSGSVVWQDPKPGTIIPRGQKCKIKCEATLNLNKLVKY